MIVLDLKLSKMCFMTLFAPINSGVGKIRLFNKFSEAISPMIPKINGKSQTQMFSKPPFGNYFVGD